MRNIIETQDLRFSYTTEEGVAPVVLDGVTAPAYLHVQSLAWCAAALLIGSAVFKKAQDKFILKI